MQALRDMGIRREDLEPLGIRIAKFGMTFPLEPRFCARVRRGLWKPSWWSKKSAVSSNCRCATRSTTCRARRPFWAKQDARGEPPVAGPRRSWIRKRSSRCQGAGDRWPASLLEQIERRLKLIDGSRRAAQRDGSTPRHPNFCSGCPHNRSTLLLEGQVAGGGHRMPRHGDRARTDAGPQLRFLTHMGGEGAPWIGMAPFVERQHMFQNIGDGTYFHSGQLAAAGAGRRGRQHHLQDSLQRRAWR